MSLPPAYLSAPAHPAVQAKPLLRELQQLVAAQIADTQPLLRLSGIVEHLLLQQQQRPAPTSAASAADYSVQWLDLRIYPDGQQPTPQALQLH